MSLQFVIDGYNIIKHRLFTQYAAKKINEPKNALLEFIRLNRPCGSPNNKITVVFDGYPDAWAYEKTDVNIMFSRGETADETIKRMVEESGNPKSIIVVSDDKEIRFFAKSTGARHMNVEEFVGSKKNLRLKKEQEDSLELKLTYTQMHKINEELKKVWRISS